MANDAATAGTFCWMDLLSSDIETARGFYCDLFGWTASGASAEFGGYFMFFSGGTPVAGGMPAPGGMAGQDQWGLYLTVDDARRAVAAAVDRGATVRQDVTRIADLGSNAILDDPEGARVGVWQADTFPGFSVQGVPGTPAWFELFARDYRSAVDFYRAVTGREIVTVSDTPEFRYGTFGSGDEASAGIMDATAMLADDQDPYWTVYVAVDDTDATLARAGELGGTTLRPAEDTPYGRQATIADPVGARIKVVGPTATP